MSLPHLLPLWDLLSQSPPLPLSPSPSPTPSLDTEVLKQQLEFLQDANTRLNNSFGSFVSAINLSFVIVGIIFTVLGGIAVYIFGQSLKEIRQSVKELVNREVDRLVTETVKAEVRGQVDHLKRILDREKIVGAIALDYVLPTRTTTEPEPFQLLAARGFKNPRLHDATSQVKLTGNVVVLDLITVAVTEEEAIAQQLDALLKRLSPEAVLVVYLRTGPRRSQALDDLANRVRYYASANTPVNLMGVVVDAAYVAHALQQVTE
jgi:hypothetical protein